VHQGLVATPELTEKTRVTAVSVVASLLLICTKLAVGLYSPNSVEKMESQEFSAQKENRNR